MVHHQFPVADQHPFAVHPGGDTHGVLIDDAVRLLEDLLIAADHLGKDVAEHTVALADNAGGIHHGLINALLIEGLDAVEGDGLRPEQLAVPDNKAVDVIKPVQGSIARYHRTILGERLVHAAQGKVADNGAGEGRTEQGRR